MIYLFGTLLLIIICLIYGVWASGKVTDSKMDYTLTCVCGEDEFDENELVYLCKSCGTCIEK